MKPTITTFLWIVTYTKSLTISIELQSQLSWSQYQLPSILINAHPSIVPGHVISTGNHVFCLYHRYYTPQGLETMHTPNTKFCRIRTSS